MNNIEYRPNLRWKPGVFVASDLLEIVIINGEIEFAGYIVNYIDGVLLKLKRRRPR